MDTVWLKGCKTEEERQQRRKEVLGLKPGILEAMEAVASLKKKEAVRDYGQPNWQALQIATNEWNAAIDHVVSILSITDTE